MELSQPRPRGAQGATPTHDFLSLYPPAQEDPTPIIPGGCLKTHDFLQPLEQVGKNVDKSFPPGPPTMAEHALPGGMGTYSIYINRGQKVPKAEGIVISAAQSSSSNNNDENSNCSSYTGSGFTLWEDSNNVNKGKTRKENITGTRHVMRDGAMKIGAPTSMDQPSHSSSIVAASVKVDAEKPSSPRSKHSATEQRRRSKINDRISMLRGIIPHGDQKRDKASFLLEVIEYIQFLQEKVHRYEDSFQGWTNEPPNTIPMNNRPTNSFIDQPRLTPTFAFSPKATDNHSSSIPPTIPTQILLLDSNTSSLDAIKETNQNTAASHTHVFAPDTHSRSCTTDKLKDQELIIESGTINISTIYSQGLSSALTQALKSSGLDLSHANISVQVDLGKRSNTSPLDLKESETPLVNDSLARSRLASTWEEESGEGSKRLKTSSN